MHHQGPVELISPVWNTAVWNVSDATQSLLQYQAKPFRPIFMQSNPSTSSRACKISTSNIRAITKARSDEYWMKKKFVDDAEDALTLDSYLSEGKVQNVNVEYGGYTAMSKSVKQKNRGNNLRYLLTYYNLSPVILNISDKWGWNALDYAIMHGCIDNVKVLLDFNADRAAINNINFMDKNTRKPIVVSFWKSIGQRKKRN